MIGQAAGERIAVSLVTGFLGSGKTTLIAALLKQPAMAGTAVIVNEFGAVGIDDAIFAQSLDANDVLLLANGCLCCTAGDDLAATVWSLARRTENRPRRIVIETTGLADPAPVLRRLMGDPRLKQATRLDAVIATVDAVNGLRNLDDQPVASRQAAIADRRLVTKADLVRSEDVEALRRRLAALNPGADVRPVDHGFIDATELFGASLYDSESGKADVDRWLNLKAHRGSVIHGHAHEADNPHEPTAGTWLIERNEPVDWGVLSGRLGEIIRIHGDRLLRVKGVISTTGDERPLVIHGVQRLFHPPVRLERSDRGHSGSSIVVIGEQGAGVAVNLIAEALAASAVFETKGAPRRTPASVPA